MFAFVDSTFQIFNVDTGFEREIVPVHLYSYMHLPNLDETWDNYESDLIDPVCVPFWKESQYLPRINLG